MNKNFALYLAYQQSAFQLKVLELCTFEIERIMSQKLKHLAIFWRGKRTEGALTHFFAPLVDLAEWF